ncbi:MAG: acetone carboxylase, gamma subunit [Solirubrobacteraceae bacterium]|jgi:acetone carboxylase gamma subunit|nr:acetone carboxylase, gamma subunit [Solirubrobacteraceae bacterium]
MDVFTIGSVKYERSNERLACSKCDGRLCAWGENYKEFATSRTLGSEEMRARLSSSYYLKEHDEVELREFVCPHCGLLLDFEVYRAGEPARLDFEPPEAARARGYDARAQYEAAPESWISFS